MNTTETNEATCCICCKEIPLDAAFTPEGVHYVTHFCGLECYQCFVVRNSESGGVRDDVSWASCPTGCRTAVPAHGPNA